MFPYLPREPFLETEIKYYLLHKDIELIIMPINKSEEKREIDTSIQIDNYLIDNLKKYKLNKKRAFIKTLFSEMFYKEFYLEKLFKNKIKFKEFKNTISMYQIFYDLFNDYFKKQNNLSNTIIYTYWHESCTYALQSLKKKYKYKLISRIHRYDIYKERRILNYMPLKKLFTTNIDKIYTITESANKYLENTYGFKKDILKLSRLGVDDFNIVSLPSDKNTFHIVSCAFLLNTKRIDKIIDSLVLLRGIISSNIKIKWSHIGDGLLKTKLEKYSQEKLLKLENLEYNFLGFLRNKDIYNFYKNNNVDVFINVSESEGVPVSIMEAMSCHIPIIAPNIGGVSDMIINNKNGILMSNNADLNEISNALTKIEFFKNFNTRKNSYQLYLSRYNAKKNYNEFINEIKRI
jgi:colanic acid/amylovoran biosynthesis glycosyltransferase